MASYFGEILESSSRAYDGNCEDISQPDDPISYELTWRTDDDPAERALFIILDGKCAIGISESLRCHGSLVAEISECRRKGDDDTQWRTRESPSFIYRLSNGVYVCEVSPNVKLVNANYFSSKLRGFLKKSKDVLIIASRSSHEYFSPHCDSFPVIRGLSNPIYRAGGGRLHTPPIGPCNIVCGVPASVILWCSLKKISASLYVCYTPKEEMDSILWSMCLTVLSEAWPVKDFLSKINFKEKERANRTGNLYL